MECRTNSKSTSFVKDFTFGLNLSYDVTWPVFNRLKGFRERAKTWVIQLSRCLHTQCLMRTYRIIDISPIIKFSLTVRKIMKRVISQHFHFQCSMKAFILSHRLWMVRSRITHINAKSDQPDGQVCKRISSFSSPWRSVIHDHTFRQSISSESISQQRLYGTLFSSQQALRRIEKRE